MKSSGESFLSRTLIDSREGNQSSKNQTSGTASKRIYTNTLTARINVSETPFGQTRNETLKRERERESEFLEEINELTLAARSLICPGCVNEARGRLRENEWRPSNKTSAGKNIPCVDATAENAVVACSFFVCSFVRQARPAGPDTSGGGGGDDDDGDAGDEFRERPLQEGRCKFILGVRRREEGGREKGRRGTGGAEWRMEAFKGENCFGVNEMPAVRHPP